MVQCATNRAAATLALARGDGDGAARSARRALEHAQACGAAVDAALSRLVLGRGLALAGAKDDAIAELERAFGELDAMGAEGHRDAVAVELRALGHRVPRRGRRGSHEAGAAALSGREREVAELAAEGLTNKQIAARLYLSDKTVESHLSHAFDKLGVNSRAAVGAKLTSVSEDGAG
jgi:DNA-binding CsgD family transcriptional regulator